MMGVRNSEEQANKKGFSGEALRFILRKDKNLTLMSIKLKDQIYRHIVGLHTS